MFLRHLLLSNVFGVCGTLELRPTQNLVILVGANHAGKTSVLNALTRLASHNMTEVEQAKLVNWYAIKAGQGKSVEARIEAIIETNLLVPAIITDNKTSEQRKEILNAAYHQKLIPSSLNTTFLLKREFHSSYRSPGTVKHGKNEYNLIQSPYDWAGYTIPPATLQTLFRSVPHDHTVQLERNTSVASKDFSGLALRTAWDVKDIQEAANQVNTVKQKHLSDLDSQSPAKLRSFLPPTLPADYSVVVTRSRENPTQAELDIVDTIRSTRLDGVQFSHGTARRLAIQLALGQPAIILIDEIENGLHPSQQLDLLRELRKASEHRTIIVTTHSETILRAASMAEVLVVDQERTPTTVSTRVSPLSSKGIRTVLKRDFAGLSPLPGRTPTPLILVEGFSDKWHVDNHVLHGEFYGWNILDDAETTWANGSQLPNYSRWLHKEEVRHVVQLDNDDAGKRALKDLEKLPGVIPVLLPWEGTIEDLYWPATLAESLFTDLQHPELRKMITTVQERAQANPKFCFRDVAALFHELTGDTVDKVQLADNLAKRQLQPRRDRTDQLRNTLGEAVTKLLKQT